jgi:uncharacterized membrane protein YkoI
LALAGSGIASSGIVVAQDQSSRGRVDIARGQEGRWGTTTPEQARQAVSQGWALPLSSVLPVVLSAVAGQVLEVDLNQAPSGEWQYKFLVLTRDRRYREVLVDARRNQVLRISGR